MTIIKIREKKTDSAFPSIDLVVSRENEIIRVDKYLNGILEYPLILTAEQASELVAAISKAKEVK